MDYAYFFLHIKIHPSAFIIPSMVKIDEDAYQPDNLSFFRRFGEDQKRFQLHKLHLDGKKYTKNFLDTMHFVIMTITSSGLIWLFFNSSDDGCRHSY